MAEHWWLILLRGIAAVLFGILSLVWPGISALSLVLLWGAYTFADGIFSLGPPSWARRRRRTGQRWWLALTGVLGIVAGLIAFFAPVLTGGVLLIFIAIWAIAIGVMCDRRRHPAPQGDRGRVAADPERRPRDHLRRHDVHSPRRRRRWR